MATFAEINAQLVLLRQRREIFHYILEHLDATFRGHDGKQPPKVIVTPDGVKVPEEVFEAVSSEVASVLSMIDQQTMAIEAAQVTPVVPTQAPAAQENASGSDQPAVQPVEQSPRGRRGRAA